MRDELRQELVLSLPVTEIEVAGDQNITHVRFQLYVISKEVLNESSGGRRFLREWEEMKERLKLPPNVDSGYHVRDSYELPLPGSSCYGNVRRKLGYQS